MNEQTAIVRELDGVLDHVGVCLSAVPDAILAWRPSVHEGNDARTIATHIVGATRSYALGLGLGRPVGRDRVAEFAPSDIDAAMLLDEIALLRDDLRRAGLERLDLDHPIVVPDAWVGPAADGTRRDALLEALRHASIHLGELRLVLDLALVSGE